MKKILIIVPLLLMLFTTSCSKQKTYVVTFDSNGGTEVVEQRVDKGSKIVEPAKPFLKGYKFVGWYKDNSKWDFKNDVVNSNIKLVAKWEKLTVDDSIKVVFNSYGGTPIPTMKIERNTVIEKPDDPKKTGYTFLGWYNNDKLFDFTKPIEDNLTLFAKWEANEYKISYYLNGSLYHNDSIIYGENYTTLNKNNLKDYVFIQVILFINLVKLLNF